jgi:hypothetical protein
MDKTVDFDFLPEASTDLTSTCPILIKTGEFKDIVYRYGKISFQELEDGGLNISMEIEMIKSPEGFDKNNEKFVETVGNIFTTIVEQQVTTQEKDLEADVHEDPVDNT